MQKNARIGLEAAKAAGNLLPWSCVCVCSCDSRYYLWVCKLILPEKEKKKTSTENKRIQDQEEFDLPRYVLYTLSVISIFFFFSLSCQGVTSSSTSATRSYLSAGLS